MLELFLLTLLAAPAEPVARDVRLETARGIVRESFDSAALSWRSATRPATIRVRASNGATWSDWIEMSIDGHLSEADHFFTNIVHFDGEQSALEYAIEAEATEVTATLFDSSPRTRDREISILETRNVGSLPIRSRTQWGCPDGEGSRWTPAYTKVTHAVVHHTAGVDDVPDWDAEVRNIWHFHTVTRGWGDIGYNYLIAPNGVIYEGRAGGLGAIGAHFSCRNSNTVGVSLLGTFTSKLPTAAALESLEKLLRALAAEHSIDVTQFALHAPTGLNVPTIIGHRDGNASSVVCSTTSCPGDAFYPTLPALRTRVACVPAAIDAHVESTAISAGGTATLSVSAIGSEPRGYQWYVGLSSDESSPIAGANSATLTVSPSVTTSYWVKISNDCGSVSSSAVIVVGSSPRRRPARSRG